MNKLTLVIFFVLFSTASALAYEPNSEDALSTTTEGGVATTSTSTMATSSDMLPEIATSTYEQIIISQEISEKITEKVTPIFFILEAYLKRISHINNKIETNVLQLEGEKAFATQSLESSRGAVLGAFETLAASRQALAEVEGLTREELLSFLIRTRDDIEEIKLNITFAQQKSKEVITNLQEISN